MTRLELLQSKLQRQLKLLEIMNWTALYHHHRGKVAIRPEDRAFRGTRKRKINSLRQKIRSEIRRG